MDQEPDGSKSSKKEKSMTLQVRFTTKQKQFAVGDYPFAIESDVDSKHLNNLINQLLQDDGLIDEGKEFDFLIGGEFLRGTLGELVLRHEALKKGEGDADRSSKIDVETVFEVEYVERVGAPQPKDCLMHDDWVSAVDVQNEWILTGSYDFSLHLWSLQGKHKQGYSAHSGEVKAVCWIPQTSDSALFFASGSQDQTVMLWEWNADKNTVKCNWVGKGHERSVECLKADDKGSTVASGSWDGQIKMWAIVPKEKIENTEENKPITCTPIMTLSGHKESVSSVDWTENKDEIITSSWDHTLKIWDVEMGGMKSQIAGNKAFFDLSYSELNKTAVTASADRHIRIYDPRSNEGSLVKSNFTSHSAWVSSVRWSKTDENLFISGAYDNLMKMWDRRSPRAPLYNMTGHTDKILCTSWGNPKFMMSGGADNSLRVYAA